MSPPGGRAQTRPPRAHQPCPPRHTTRRNKGRNRSYLDHLDEEVLDAFDVFDLDGLARAPVDQVAVLDAEILILERCALRYADLDPVHVSRESQLFQLLHRALQ